MDVEEPNKIWDLDGLNNFFEQLEGLNTLRAKINSRKPAFGDTEVKQYQQAWDAIACYMPKTKPEFIEFMGRVRSAYDSIEQELTKICVLEGIGIENLELTEEEIDAGDFRGVVDKIYKLVKGLKCAPSQCPTSNYARLDERLEELAMQLRDYDENISNELEDIAGYLKNPKK